MLSHSLAESCSEIIFVLAGGIMLLMEKSNAVENGIGTLIKRLGRERATIVVIMTLFMVQK